MPFDTDTNLRSRLDSNQLHRERMCLAILAIDRRFSEVQPRQPHGGPDGGRDIQAIFKDDTIAYGAVGFVNGANDSASQKTQIKKKFKLDIDRALSVKNDLKAFVFFTNVNLTTSDEQALDEYARSKGITFCDTLDRERIRIALDSPDGFSVRYQYLGITLSEAEQASFFARWGDDINSLVATGFKKVESKIDRLLFLQECNDEVDVIRFVFQLDKQYDAEDIGHFRAFCALHLTSVSTKYFGLIFGSTDRADRLYPSACDPEAAGESGIKHGISRGQWRWLQKASARPSSFACEDYNTTTRADKYKNTGSGTSIGMDTVKYVTADYRFYRSSYYRSADGHFFRMKDLDMAVYMPMLSLKFAEKVMNIHIYVNDYKISEFAGSDFVIDYEDFVPSIPVKFSDEELRDKWVRIRPGDRSSAFRMLFSEHTPKRIFEPSHVTESLRELR